MRYFPFFFKLDALSLLVVGGGDIALSKVRLLLKSKANILLIAPKIREDLQTLLKDKGASFEQRTVCEEDIRCANLIICATDDATINDEVYRWAKHHHKLINVVDSIPHCDFIFPALVERGELTVAISTGGVAPVFANWLRTRIEQSLPKNAEIVLEVLQKLRQRIKSAIPNVRSRRTFYAQTIEGGLLANNKVEFAAQVEQRLSPFDASQKDHVVKTQKGKVFLVGAGPGDPELLTLRAHRVLQQADVILYDRLVGEAVLDLSRREAKRVFVGKARSNHYKKQEEINQLLVDYANKGDMVVRLKGGDPFIFGRGGEELHQLNQHGIDVEVIPGISAANGCAARFKIPLTLRGVSDRLTYLTTFDDGLDDLDWQQLARCTHTLALYMSLATLPKVCQKLIEFGASLDHPLAIIEKGTLENERIHYSNLSDIATNGTKNFQSPALTIIGLVATNKFIV